MGEEPRYFDLLSGKHVDREEVGVGAMRLREALADIVKDRIVR